MGKDAAAGVTEEGCTGIIRRLVLLGHKAPQRQRRGIAQKQGAEKGDQHIFEQQMPGSQLCCFFHKAGGDHPDQCIGENEDHEDGRDEIHAPGDQKFSPAVKKICKKCNNRFGHCSHTAFLLI